MKQTKKGLSKYLSTFPHLGGIVVCPERKFIYMKPTKTAGTSILRNLLEKQVPNIIHYKDHAGEFNEWLSYINDDLLEEYFIFSVVRNPWDRFVSISSYFKIPFHDFLHNFEMYQKREEILTHSLPLHLYTHINGDRFVDVICRMETLQDDMNLVMDKIGLRRQKLPHVNRSKHKQYTRLYSDEDKDLVAKLYAMDIDIFGYRFEKVRTSSKNIFSNLFN